MKKLSFVLAAFFVFSTILTGCSSLSNIGSSIVGINVLDLEKLKPYSPTKDFDLSYQDTFALMQSKIIENGLHQYLSNPGKGYIVVIGLSQQVNTTRIGIFIDSNSDSSTRVTLTAKSSTALDRAQLIFFGETQTDVTILE